MNIWLRIYYAIVGEPSAEKSIKNLNRAAAKLDKAVAYRSEKAEKQRAMARAAATAALLNDEAAEKARRVHGKLADLLS